MSPQLRGQARLPPGRVISGWARHPLGLRDKAIQYLQEHIWQRGSTINLPPFNSLCSRLAIAASAQQFLEAAIPLPSRAPPCWDGDQKHQHPCHGLSQIFRVSWTPGVLPHFPFPKFLIYLPLTHGFLQLWQLLKTHTKMFRGQNQAPRRSLRTKGSPSPAQIPTFVLKPRFFLQRFLKRVVGQGEPCCACPDQHHPQGDP